MTILQIQKNDSQHCCDIINNCVVAMSGLNQVAEDFIIAKNTPEILFKELGRCYTLVYESDNRILAVGAICGSEIKRVYVDPEFQGKGIGSSIVAALEKAATSQKCKMLV